MGNLAQIVDAAKAGDAAALQELLDRHLAGLRVFVRLRVDEKLRAKESCSDLVQSACREALEHLGQFEYRGEASFRNWLYTAALNKIHNRREYWAADKRDAGRERPLPSSGQDGELAQAYASVTSPSQQAMGHELVERLERAFDVLPAQYREVLTLSRIAGQSTAEIAAQLGKSEGAIRTTLSRALVRLSELLASAR